MRRAPSAVSTALAFALAACGGRAVIDPLPCDDATCPDGYCDTSGRCVTRAAICTRACELIVPCMTPPEPTCFDFCYADLADCGHAEMQATDTCTDLLAAPCDSTDADAWVACVDTVPCLGSTGP